MKNAMHNAERYYHRAGTPRRKERSDASGQKSLRPLYCGLDVEPTALNPFIRLLEVQVLRVANITTINDRVLKSWKITRNGSSSESSSARPPND